MNGGLITQNGHWAQSGLFSYDASTGGAVFVEDGGLLIQNGGEVKDNRGDPADIHYIKSDESTIVVYEVEHYIKKSDESYKLEETSNITGSIGDDTRDLVIDYSGYNAVIFDPETVAKDTETVKIYYDYGLSFSLTIPDALVISPDSYNGEMSIAVNHLDIPEDGKLSVSVKSGNNFNLVCGSDSLSYRGYFVDGGQKDIKDNPILFTMEQYNVQSSAPLERVITAELINRPVYSGKYMDTLTFTVQYIED